MVTFWRGARIAAPGDAGAIACRLGSEDLQARRDDCSAACLGASTAVWHHTGYGPSEAGRGRAFGYALLPGVGRSSEIQR